MTPRAALAAGLLLAGCSKPAPAPTESVLVAREAAVPGLSKPKPGDSSPYTAHRGDVFVRPKSWGQLRWGGDIQGGRVEREGEILEVHRSTRDGMVFVFSSDLEPAEVPASTWFCAQSPRHQQSAGVPCPEVLLRIRVDASTTVGYPPCVDERCLLGLARGGRVSWTEVTRLGQVELRRLGGRPVLAVRRARQGGKVTGVHLTLIGAEPELPELLDVPLDITDGTDHPHMRYRSLRPSFEPEALVLEGDEREVDARTGQEVARRPVREVYRRQGERVARAP